MPTVGNVYVQTLTGHLRVVIEGDDPSHPWEILLQPQAAFNLGNELRVKAEDLGVQLKTQVQSRSNAQPARRPPSNEGQGRGPQSSSDGIPSPPDSFQPKPPAGSSGNDNLLGVGFS